MEIYNIKISDVAVKYVILTWLTNKSLADRPRNNRSKWLISRDGVLAINRVLLEIIAKKSSKKIYICNFVKTKF